jgi:hypothetical protein
MTRLVCLICVFFVVAVQAFSADRALVVGIDNYQSVNQTPGSVADARAMKAFIQRKYNFPDSSVHMLLEGDATAANIKNEIQTWLIDGTKPGDRVFFFYSGHGGQVDDDNGDEADHLDEVLAPYDVYVGKKGTPPANIIRDDQMNLFLLQLSGRRVVMAFDSCNSGTISRSLEPKSKFVALYNQFTEPEAVSRSMSDRDSYVPTEATTRDLSVVKEDVVDGRLNGIIIFSATSAYQKAMWLKDQSRGAFAYSFEMVQQQDGYYPTAAEIDQKIRTYLDDLKRKGLVNTAQVPQMEIISDTRLDDQPLFSQTAGAGVGGGTGDNWETSVLPAIHNPLADFKVKLTLGSNRFKVGDKVTYSAEVQGLKTGEQAYLYILVFSVEDGGKRHVTSLFPTKIGNDTDNKVSNGTQCFPRKGISGADYTTEAVAPGKDLFVALVAKKPLPIGNRDEYTWDEAYSLIGIDALREQVKKKAEELTRSMSNRPKIDGGDWQASTAVVRVF